MSEENNTKQRKKIPDAIKRALLEETVYRCASCLCSIEHYENDDRFTRFGEMAHIEPHSKTQDDSFENLIVLCPTCHTKFDKNKDKAESEKRLRSLKKQWLGVSGKYSKLEIDCLLDLYNKDQSEWIREVSIDYATFASLKEFEDAVMGNDFVMAGGIFYFSDSKKAENFFNSISKYSDSSLSKCTEALSVKRIHTPAEETDASGNKINKYGVCLDFDALIMLKPLTFLFRNILNNKLIQPLPLSHVTLYLNNFAWETAALALTKKGFEFCEKLSNPPQMP